MLLHSSGLSVFEGTAFNEDHEPEYRRIHEEFRNLVYCF